MRYHLIICLLAVILTGCHKENPPNNGKLKEWISIAANDGDAISNLAAIGLIIEHDLNTGVVTVNKEKWNMLNDSEKSNFRNLMQRSQNLNLPKSITITPK